MDCAAPWPELNLGFEQISGEQPTGWRSGTTYEWSAAGDPRHGGAHSLRLHSAGKGPFGAVVASVAADPVRGKRLILHGWIKTEGVKGSAALFLRIDGGGGAFDNMGDRGITGTVDWTEVAVDVDVPTGGEHVVFGPLLSGEGTAWFDDLLGARDGVVVHGTIGPGKPTAPAYVQIAIVSEHEGDLFAVPVADDGTFEATLPRGTEYAAALLEGGIGRGSSKPAGDGVVPGEG